MIINFIEKELSKDIYGNRFYPNYMQINGEERFIYNRRDYQPQWMNEENERIKKQLVSTEGKYYKGRGAHDDPLSLLKDMCDHRLTFESVSFCTSTVYEGFVDFHGHICQTHMAFHYRIYNNVLAEQVKNILYLVMGSKYAEAEKMF